VHDGADLEGFAVVPPLLAGADSEFSGLGLRVEGLGFVFCVLCSVFSGVWAVCRVVHSSENDPESRL